MDLPQRTLSNHSGTKKSVVVNSILIEGGNILKQWLTQNTLEMLFGVRDETVAKAEIANDQTQPPCPSSVPQSSSELFAPLNHRLTHNINDYVDEVSIFFGDTPASSVRNQELIGHEQLPMPKAHVHESEAQQVRENIVLKQVQMLVNDLSPPLPNIIPELRAFVKSLNLTKLNVVLRVELWPVLTIAILYLLSLKNIALQNVLDSDGFSNVLQKILRVYGTNISSLKKTVFEIPLLHKHRKLPSAS